MTDVADVPVYNPGITLLTQGRKNYIYEPEEQLAQSTAEIDPGQTFWSHYRLVPEITGILDVGDSFVEDVGGNVTVASTIESQPATPIGDVPTLNAVTEPGGVELTWQAPSVSGIDGYEIFYTPTNDTLFGATPVESVSSTAQSAFIPSGVSGFYAVSTIVDGTPTMYNPLVGVGQPGSNVVVETETSGNTTTTYKIPYTTSTN